MSKCDIKDPFDNVDNNDLIKNVVNDLYESYQDEQGINHLNGGNLPSKNEIKLILDQLEEIIFPGFKEKKVLDIQNVHYFIGNILSQVYVELSRQIKKAFLHEYRYENLDINCEECEVQQYTNEAVRHLIQELPRIRENLKYDVIAAHDSDPAAKSYEEIILSYPGTYATVVHRIAHELYKKNVPFIPRMMSEYAHSAVGIDIHPGARIGESFFIDHGTGVVIGETAILGKNVKIYQGVTLGAVSFPKDEFGNIIKGKKRHPTIEDGVTIYSNATILGDITIGKGSVIGGNVWLTKDVDPETIVVIAKPDLKVKSKNNKK